MNIDSLSVIKIHDDNFMFSKFIPLHQCVLFITTAFMSKIRCESKGKYKYLYNEFLI